MKFSGVFNINKKNIHLLFNGSKRAVPVNILVAFLIALNLRYSAPPFMLVVLWFALVFMVCALRWMFCDWALQKNRYKKRPNQKLFFFFILTLFMGTSWGLCYFLAVTYHPNEPHEFIVLLIFSGLCTDAIASLFIWIPAYLAYVVPMFLPIIIYNLSLLNGGRALLAAIISLVIGMMYFSAKSNNTLFNQALQLAKDKERLINNLKSISTTDDLTGLYNRRYFNEQLQKELNRAKRNQYAINYISIDVDNFKLINDHLGHPNGDLFLKYLAKILQNAFKRSNDVLFRLGGDEFAAIIVNRSLDETIEQCTKIQKFLIKSPCLFDKEYPGQSTILNAVTLSMGIVHIQPASKATLKQIILAADNALYSAKNNGKNKIISTDLD